MNKGQSNRKVIILVILAFVLSVSFAVLLVRQEMARRRAGIEFQVYQVMTGLVDGFNAGETFNPEDWPEISGFGIYSDQGDALFHYGTAPQLLERRDTITSRGIAVLSATSMVIIRRIGTLPPMHRPGPPHRGMMRFMEDGMMGRQLEPDDQPPFGRTPPGKNRYVYIDIDVNSMVREGRLVLFAVLALLSVFVCIVSLVLMYSRRLSDYRERERQSAHLIQLGEAARTLAHEIKNPLGVIRVQCATLQRTLPEGQRKNISIIEEETERLVLLTDRVRDFLQTSEGNPVVRPSDYYLEQCAQRYGDRIRISPREGPSAQIRIDADRMLHALDNLIANALESMDGKSVGSTDAISSCELSLTVRKGQVFFRVADRGSGVLPENRPRLFEPFFTTKARGSGIGLALSRRFVEQASGSLTYESRPGGGSVFTLSLPADDSARAAERSEADNPRSMP